MLKVEIVLLTNNSVLPFQDLQTNYKLNFVDLNKLYATKLLAEHGLGFLINIYDMDDLDDKWNPKLLKKIIFDTGSRNLTYLHNLEVMGYNVEDANNIVLSHWHYDHTGGLLPILERIKKEIPVICHIDSKYERFFRRSNEIKDTDLNGKSKQEIEPLLSSNKIVLQEPATLERIKELNGKIFYSKHAYELFKHKDLKITVSGEITRNHEEEDFNNFFLLNNEKLQVDKILDDKCLIFEFKDYILILNGCCHSGLMNTIDYVKGLTNKLIAYIIGGFHMENASEERFRATIRYLKSFQDDYKPLYMFPIHCSGERFVQEINASRIQNTRAFNCSVGSIFEFKTSNF